MQHQFLTLFYYGGGKTEEAVLCTDSQTYEIREAETSNNLVIIPGLLWPKESNLNESLDKSCEEDALNDINTSNSNIDVTITRSIQTQCAHKILNTFYEVHQIKPKFRKLYELLQLTRYSGQENEYKIDKRFLFTYNQLLATVQASSKELQEGFLEIRAMEIDNYFRILDLEYEFRIVSYMLAVIEENSWNFQSISRDITIESLKDIVPQNILEGLFDIYTAAKGNDQFSYKQELISR